MIDYHVPIYYPLEIEGMKEFCDSGEEDNRYFVANTMEKALLPT